MKRILFKFLKWIGIITLILILGVFLFVFIQRQSKISAAKDKMFGEAPVLIDNGHKYRDLNKNGKMDPYENNKADIDTRVEDLLGKMSIDEKTSQMMQPFLFSTKIDMVPMKIMAFMNPSEDYVNTRGLTHLTSALAPDDATVHIEWVNEVQKLAEQTRLGIPVSFSSDPRHSNKKGAAVFMKSLSQWPDATGLAAIGDSLLTYRFGQIAAREYRAIGLSTALHPVADLATEPRWGRIAGSFGENAELSAKLTAAYIYGMQGDSLTLTSVSTMTKHFSGGGPQKDGEDAHFKYGKDQVYPGNNFDYHVIPFRAAIKAGTAQMMPYYGIPVGQTSEDVGFAFNKEIISGLLIDSLQYKGIICSDWGILRDPDNPGNKFVDPMDHGVEDLDVYSQAEKALNAGIDQFGGSDNPSIIMKLVEEGRISEERLDFSVKKLLRQKFALGLFDQPYLNLENSLKNINRPEDRALGHETMKRSVVLLKNKGDLLPLKKTNIYIENLDPEVVSNYATVVKNPEDADVAILNLNPPFTPREGIIESIFHQGRLNFLPEEIEHVKSIAEKTTVIISLYLERPFVFPEINNVATAVIGHFSISDKAIIEVILGHGKPEGNLPFELPSSIEAVENQFEDVPYDSKDPLYNYGHGLRYDRPR